MTVKKVGVQCEEQKVKLILGTEVFNLKNVRYLWCLPMYGVLRDVSTMFFTAPTAMFALNAIFGAA